MAVRGPGRRIDASNTPWGADRVLTWQYQGTMEGKSSYITQSARTSSSRRSANFGEVRDGPRLTKSTYVYQPRLAKSVYADTGRVHASRVAHEPELLPGGLLAAQLSSQGGPHGGGYKAVPEVVAAEHNGASQKAGAGSKRRLAAHSDREAGQASRGSGGVQRAGCAGRGRGDGGSRKGQGVGEGGTCVCVSYRWSAR